MIQESRIFAAEKAARRPLTDSERRRLAQVERLNKAWEAVFEALTSAGLRDVASAVRPFRNSSLNQARGGRRRASS